MVLARLAFPFYNHGIRSRPRSNSVPRFHNPFAFHSSLLVARLSGCLQGTHAHEMPKKHVLTQEVEA